MPTFIYQAKNEKGQIVSGTVDAQNERTASQLLWENKLRVITLEPKPIVPQLALFNRVSVTEKSVFARQLSTMISAGLHLTNALNICIVQTRNRRLKDVLVTVIRDVEAGYSFSSAISKHPDVFDRVFVAVVKAGETAGKLDQVLLSLADRLEKDAEFRSKIRGALAYPAFVFVMLLVVGTIMLIKVIPQIKSVLEESGVPLPWATRAIIATSNFLQKGWWGVLLAIILIVILVRMYLKTERGSKWWGNFVLSMPVFGDLNKSIIMTRFTQTFGLLVKTGIPILDALNSLADVMDNEMYKISLYKAARDVERGIPLSVPITKDKLFPPIISQMIGVGEQSGSLDTILDRLGSFYENSVEDRTKTLGALIEPIIIVLLGIAIAILILAVLMPIYSMVQTV